MSKSNSHKARQARRPSDARRVHAHTANGVHTVDTDEQSVLTALWINQSVVGDVFGAFKRSGVGHAARVIAATEGGKEGAADPNAYWRPIIVQIVTGVVGTLDAAGKTGAVCTVGVAEAWLRNLSGDCTLLSEKELALLTAAVSCVCIGEMAALGCPLTNSAHTGPIVGRARANRVVRV